MFTNTKKYRAGFTMIELLVVIAVVALMVALMVGASFRFVVSAREAATAATITKVSGIIQDRVRAFREFDFSDAGTAGSQNWNANNPGDQISSGLAEVLFRKTRFKVAFPQSLTEVNLNNLSVRLFPNGAPAAGTLAAKYEAGIVLYAVLMRGETFGVTTPGDDAFTSAEIKTNSDTGNLPCLVDAWGEPLRFYRWPTRLIRCGEQNFNASAAGYDDINQNGSQDPPGWVDSASGPTFSPAIRPNSNFPGQTPASLLIANLPPFDPPGSTYYFGPDTVAGSPPSSSTLGFPDTDDPEPLNIDPDDPGFLLIDWLFDNNILAATQLTRRNQFKANLHDFFTFYTPLVVSAGPDKQLGLFEPNDFPNFGNLAAPILTPATKPSLQIMFDNITNLNQRAGGK